MGTEAAILELGMSTTVEDLRAGKLKGATKLDLSWAKLDKIPAEVFDLADTLEVLNLQGNALTSLPEDMKRLKKLRILFLSNNKFTEVPRHLGGCPELSMLALRSCGLEEVPPEALAPSLRWLILTDNKLKSLPAEVGKCSGLQKLMLAGNRLESLPEELATCKKLELIRLASNRLIALPPWLKQLPKLTWVALAGNPLTIAPVDDAVAAPAPAGRHGMDEIAWEGLVMGDRLGQGASGEVFRAKLGDKDVAVKVFKGEVTSDGLPECEMDAVVAAGRHPNMPRVLGVVKGHPEGKKALVLELVPLDFKPLAGPPSFETCTRDVYEEGAEFSLEKVNAVPCVTSPFDLSKFPLYGSPISPP